MSRFRVTNMDGKDKVEGGSSYDNRAIEIDRNDPVQLSAYGLYTKRGSVTTPPSSLHVGDHNGSAPAPTQQRKSSNASRDMPRKISLGIAQWTREALPRLDNYRQSVRVLRRPSLSLLHGEALDHIPESKDAEAQHPPQSGHTGIKLGWIVGVLIPCLLNIWGVMLFLRLAWVVAQAGILQSLIIIGISAVVCVITTLSLSAICTNGDVKGGGIYYIISRSLGPEFGASVGIVFAFANAVAASMNTIGFCSSMNDLLKSFGLKIVDGGANDIRIVGIVALAVMIVICAVGMEWETKAQNFLIAIIVAAIFSFIIGANVGPSNDVEKAQGFVGFSTELFVQNWGPDYRLSEKVDQTFFSVFAIFFPSVTGIQAGANISGDLRDPASSIPKGTMLSLLISMTSYALFVLFAGGSAVRDASGNINDLVNGSVLHSHPSCAANHTCEFGLHNSYVVMQLMSASSMIIFAGCFAATLSTALTNLLSVPRLIQALGIDRIYPGLIFFSKGYGKHGEPYRGYVLTFFISLAFLLIAELNLIAPLISNFYLASYALINFCTFHAAFVKPLGWRPTFRYYNAWLSLFGFVLCVSIMFLIQWESSLITFIIILALYLVVMYRKPDVNWGSSTQAQTYKTALTAAYRLQQIDDHVKNYRPQVLVLAGTLHMRPALIDLANLITKHNSLMIVGDVIPNKVPYKTRMRIMNEGHQWLAARKVKAFYDVVEGFDFESGVRALIQTSGVGKLSPNILLMGYKSDWQVCPKRDLTSYFNVLHYAFSSRLSVAILRMPKGLDCSQLNIGVDAFNLSLGGLTTSSSMSNITQIDIGNNDPSGPGKRTANEEPTIMPADSYLNLTTLSGANGNDNGNRSARANGKLQNDPIVYTTTGGSCVPKEILDEISIFYVPQPVGTIDVWWLYDDGGLTMLIPYIMSMRSNWANCKIRVFALANHRMEIEAEERNMANLLTKLRIDYSSLTMLQDVKTPPTAETKQLHNKLLHGFNEGENNECFISNIERQTLQEKTNRQLRLRELLLEHSCNASLIVMSLPMPRQGAVSAPLYMSWLEILSKDMPPFLFIRGNQSSVLTYYS